MKILPLRFDAIVDERLNKESRDFLYDLKFNNSGVPIYNGKSAGSHACFELTNY